MKFTIFDVIEQISVSIQRIFNLGRQYGKPKKMMTKKTTDYEIK